MILPTMQYLPLDGTIYEGGVFCSQNWKVLKCQDLPKFEFSGVGGRVFCSQNWKVLNCQDLPKFEFGGGGGYQVQIRGKL